MNKKLVWGVIHKGLGTFIIDPRQCESLGFELGTELDLTFVPSITEIAGHLLIETEDFKTAKIIKTLDNWRFLSNDEIEKIKKMNDNVESEEIIINKIPKPSHLYISDLNWSLLNSLIDLKMYPLIIGPKGTGKTETVQSIAKARGMKFFPINCGSLSKPKSKLIGQTHAKDGNTFLLPSEFLNYFTDESDEGVLIFLNEISRIPQAASNYLINAIDRIQSYLYVDELGERKYKGRNVVFIADANFGFEYTDTRNIDGAFIDRFVKISFDYLPQNDEIDLILSKVKNVNRSEITLLVKIANKLRTQIETLKVSVSTRQLIDMAFILSKGFSLHSVLENVFVNLFINGNLDERQTVKKMIDAIL